MADKFKKINKGLTMVPSSVPTSPANGDLYYDSTANKFKVYQNGSWTEVTTSGGSGMTNPMTTLNDMIVGGTSGTGERLAVGYEGAELTVSSGVPTWVGGTPPEAGRAIIGGGGGYTFWNYIDYFGMATLGNASSFGTLTQARSFLGAGSSSTRGLFGGGFCSLPDSSTVDYVTIATTGNAQSFATLATAREVNTGCSNSVTAMFAGGYHLGYLSSIEKVTIATLSSTAAFGSLTVAQGYSAGTANTTTALFAGGDVDGSMLNSATIATGGTCTNVGALSVSRAYLAGCSSSTRGIFGGGGVSTTGLSTIDYVTYASLSNAVNFGSLPATRRYVSGTSNSIKGVFAGGYEGDGTYNISGNMRNSIYYVQIATTGNASSFGTLVQANQGPAACSDSHGGI